MTYSVKLTRDTNGTLLVSFPDFPEAHTFGENEADALARAADALATVMDAYVKDRRPLPVGRPARRGERTVSLPGDAAVKLTLYTLMREQHVTKSALARKLGWHLPQIDRLLNVKHRSRFEHLEKAARALGRRVQINLEALS